MEAEVAQRKELHDDLHFRCRSGVVSVNSPIVCANAVSGDSYRGSSDMDPFQSLAEWYQYRDLYACPPRICQNSWFTFKFPCPSRLCLSMSELLVCGIIRLLSPGYDEDIRKKYLVRCVRNIHMEDDHCDGYAFPISMDEETANVHPINCSRHPGGKCSTTAQLPITLAASLPSLPPRSRPGEVGQIRTTHVELPLANHFLQYLFPTLARRLHRRLMSLLGSSYGSQVVW